MATIILEGPDSSGKTTLAHALVGWMGPDKCRYVKSPAGKTKEWDEGWNEWNAYQIGRSHMSRRTYILDRTPEISELVYGPVVRGFTRLRNPLSSLTRLKHPDTLIIMTSTDKPYHGVQTDSMGNSIYEHREKIAAAYDLITLLMRYDGYQMGSWDYEESQGRRISHHILTTLQVPLMIMPMENSKFMDHVEKGKGIVNGS